MEPQPKYQLQLSCLHKRCNCCLCCLIGRKNRLVIGNC
ncbi:hypothetical protein AAZX31_17G114800 [Glycine max]